MIKVKSDKCTGCGICCGVCPMGVILVEKGKAVIINKKICLECGACRLNCPSHAILLTKGTGCLVAVLREDILKTRPKGTGCGCGNGKLGCC